MHTVTMGANAHDYAKLSLFTLAMIRFMLIVVALSSANIDCMPILFVELCLCTVIARWLGNWRWILVPLLAVLVAFAILVPGVSIR